MVLWEPHDAYWILVDANTGQLLWRKNITNDQTQSVTYEVYNDDSPTPLSPSNALPGSGIQGTAIYRSTITNISELPAFDKLGWIRSAARSEGLTAAGGHFIPTTPSQLKSNSDGIKPGGPWFMQV